MKRTSILGAALVAWALSSASALGHEHVAAGADSTDPGAPLLFASDDDFGADSGWVFTLTHDDTGPYAGYYHGEVIFVALAATGAFGGPEPQHPAPGSHVEIVLESVAGPAGGSFGFWETPGNDEDATEITFSVPVGETQGTHHIVVSENHGEPGADPYGHIHGRVYSATKPGLYKVGCRFVDTSTNGPAGGPIHTPSEKFYLNFQAGLTISGIAPSAGGIDVTFAAPSGRTYQLETAPGIATATDWKAAGDAVVGDDHLHTVTVPAPAGGAGALFRLVAQ
jgi:hypothetical protein